MCRVVDTVLVDQEAIYAPRQSNDRLLLGLKGSLNEYELDLIASYDGIRSHARSRRKPRDEWLALQPDAHEVISIGNDRRRSAGWSVTTSRAAAITALPNMVTRCWRVCCDVV